MILGSLKNIIDYYNLGENFKRGFEYLKNNNLFEMKCGKYTIDGNKVFISIEEYLGKEIEQSLWEAHKKYIDIQYIIRGKEKLGYMNIDEMKILSDYDKEKDIFFGNGKGKFLTLNEGEFVIFTPSDAHMPGIKINDKIIKKAVIKIALN